MFPMMMVYLVLVIIRPQDYPELQGAIPLPLQQVALLLAGVAWLMSGRRMNSAPQNLLLLLFMLAMMLSVAVNGWIGGAVPIFRDFAPVVLAYSCCATPPSRSAACVSRWRCSACAPRYWRCTASSRPRWAPAGPA
jgi:hypothetical protein